MVLPLRDTSETSITSVADLIELAFGEDETNIVDFRLLHAILLVLARALSLLERKVLVDLTRASAYAFRSTMSITEVKVKAKGEKTKKKKGGKSETKPDSTKSLEKSSNKSDSTPDKSKKKSKQTDSDVGTKDVDKRSKRSGETKMDSDSQNRREDNVREESDNYSTDIKLKKGNKGSEGNKKSKPQSIKDSNESETSMQSEDKSNKFTKSAQVSKKSKPQSTIESDESETHTQLDEKSTKSGKGNKNLKLNNDQKDQFEDHSSSSKSSRESVKNQTKILSDGYSDKKSAAAKKQESKTEIQTQDSSEIQQEKVLIVKTIPVSEGLAETKKYKPDDVEVPQSLVTIEQFERLVKTVSKLQERFGPIDVLGLEDDEILGSLHKTASFSDPLAVLQLSARLELAENALNQMTNLLINFSNQASKPVQEYDTADTINTTTDTIIATSDTITNTATKVDLPNTGMSDTEKLRSKRASMISNKEKDNLNIKQKQQQEKTKEALQSKRISQVADTSLADNISTKSSKKDVDAISAVSVGVMGNDEMIDSIITNVKSRDFITFSEMRDRLKDLKDDVLKSITTPLNRAQLTTEIAYKQAKKLDLRLDEASTNREEVMIVLEENIARYTEKVNAVDANFSSTMTHYQEELQKMQYVLEIALDNTAEALANRETDTEAVAELNNHFTCLQIDLDRTSLMQNELKSLERALHIDLQSLLREIERLKQVKSDREEVEKALSNKAGISVLNGKVSISQYEAVLGDIQKRIVSSYEKFNSQEIIWQKYIDEVLRDFNERAEKYQVDSLRADITTKVEMLKQRLDFMLSICGEPRINDDTRTTANKPCLSCSYPYDKSTEKIDMFSTLETDNKPTVLKKNEKEVKDIDTRRFCIPLAPHPHSLDLRTCTYKRYCKKLEDVEPDQTESIGIASSITVRALAKEIKKVPK